MLLTWYVAFTVCTQASTYHGCPGWAQMDGTTVPRILPTEVWAFHIPKNSPLFFFPNQLPITATTPGQPVDCRRVNAVFLEECHTSLCWPLFPLAGVPVPYLPTCLKNLWKKGPKIGSLFCTNNYWNKSARKARMVIVSSPNPTLK